jgi:pilus assembly protein CpaB
MWKVKRMTPARIIILVIAVVAGGIAALLAGRQEQPPAPEPVAQIETTDILVANSDIGIGSGLSAQDLRWQTWPTAAAGPNFIRKSERPDAISQLVGWITRTPFSAGEPIREAKLIRAQGSGYMAAILNPGMRAVSIDVNPETGVSGFVLPNDRVDVILSRRDREAEKAAGVEIHSSETILANVRVLAIDQTVEEKSGQKVVVGKDVTLELSPRQAETLYLSRQLGTLSLALRPLTDAEASAANDGDDKSSRGGGINVVRFGITLPSSVSSTMTPPK